jgi:hypothetical protein
LAYATKLPGQFVGTEYSGYSDVLFMTGSEFVLSNESTVSYFISGFMPEEALFHSRSTGQSLMRFLRDQSADMSILIFSIRFNRNSASSVVF